MRRTSAITGLLCALAASAATRADTYTFDVTSGDWSVPSNWDTDNGTVPGSDDHAIIPSGRTCTVSAANQSVGYLTIQTGGSGDGKLRIAAGKTLAIYDTTHTNTVDGVLEFDTTSSVTKLQFHNDVSNAIEFEGTGSIDARRPVNGTGYAELVGTASYFPVVIGSAIEMYGSFHLNYLSFENNGDLVVNHSRDLTSSTSTLYGDGSLTVSAGAATLVGTNYPATWEMTVSGGTLTIQGDLDEGLRSHFTVQSGSMIVTGSNNEFSFSDQDPYDDFAGLAVNGGTVEITKEFQGGNVVITGGTVQVDIACTVAHGTITISGGELEVSQNLSAKKLVWSGGTINVASGKSAAFTGP